MFQRTVFIMTACSLLLLQAAGVGAAGNPDNGPGCGLGKLAWMDYGSQKQIAPQVMMATTNGTFGSQTFGISSGTSGCTNDGVIMKNKHINLASRAFETLAEDMAQGRGEHLASLATLLGVPEDAQPDFFCAGSREIYCPSRVPRHDGGDDAAGASGVHGRTSYPCQGVLCQ